MGAGLAGLSTAFHLKRHPYLVVEREQRVGGTARSFAIDGFTFDITGHLLHLHNPYTTNLITALLGRNVVSCVRNAWIYSHNAYTRYPFQAYTRGLPDAVVDDCVLGFFDAYLKNKKRKRPVDLNQSFSDWCLGTFGAGISRHFMFPYNEKLFQTPANTMTADWCGPFVPMPKLEDVVEGALGNQNRPFGYNTTFLYPQRGGIQVLSDGLAKNLKNIATGESVTRIDWKKKRATLAGGKQITYRHLVNTIPLPDLLQAMSPLPKAIEEARRELKFASILCVNMGVQRSDVSSRSWIYFPEKRFPFYRVGFTTNFTPTAAPRGHSSLYIEVPMDSVSGKSKGEIIASIQERLIESRILKTSDKISIVQFLPVRHAYVIYNKERTKALSTLFPFLAKQGIASIGRYGAWKYSFMEEAILDGKAAAEKIAKQ